MWQRLQTLYIIISTGLTAALFFCNKAGDYSYISYIPYLILLIIITLLNLIELSAFKFRVFQMRTCILNAIITLALQIWLAVDYFTADKSLVFSFTAIFPLLCVILDVLAARNILADEMMVRSASRLRASRRDRKKNRS